MRPPQSRAFLESGLLFVLLALLLVNARLHPILEAPRQDVMRASDERTYTILAGNIVAGRGLSLSTEPPYVPSTARTPGYPLFLALCGALGLKSVQSVAIVQAIIDAGTGILLALTARQLGGRAAGPFALAGWLILGPGSGVACDLYSEVVAMALCAVTLAFMTRLFLRGPSVPVALAAGAALAALTLTRPAQIVWIPLAVVIVAWESRGWRMPAALSAGAAIPMAAWVARNLIVTGKPVLMTTLGVGMNFWLGTVSDGLSPTRWVDDPASGGRFEMQMSLADSDEEMRRVQSLWNDYYPALLEGKNPEKGVRADQALVALGIERWKRRPLDAARLRLVNVARLLDQPERSGGVPLAIAAWLGGLGCALALWRTGRGSAWCVLAPVVLVLAHVPLYSEARYVYPAYPMLILALAAGLARLLPPAKKEAPAPVTPGDAGMPAA